jgi:hypothetical protein
MIYLVASVVVALRTPEDRSPLRLDWLAQCRDSLISSDWLITETHSALGIKPRHHGHSTQARRGAVLARARYLIIVRISEFKLLSELFCNK